MLLLDHLADHPVDVVDLSQPVFTGMPSSPSHPGFRSALTLRHGDVDRDDGMTGAHEMFVSGSHVGTHVDALCHVAVDGRVHGGRPVEVVDGRHVAGGIDEFPLQLRRGVLVDAAAARGLAYLPGATAITADDLDSAGLDVRAGDTVLIRTGWARHWSHPAVFLGETSGLPGLDVSAATWLAERQVAVVGADTIAVEQILPEHGLTRLPVHRILLAEQGIHLIEVMNLERLAAGGVTEFAFVCAPLNLLGATGAPARPVALVDRAESPPRHEPSGAQR